MNCILRQFIYEFNKNLILGFVMEGKEIGIENLGNFEGKGGRSYLKLESFVYLFTY
jgi:hypothetical protein